MRFLRPVFAAAAVLGASGAALALEVGDEAPEIDVSQWVQGEPITLADGLGKKVFLVEFWVTFETDCIDAVGKLDGLHDKYKAQGLEVVAITTEPADDVRKFLVDHKCGYRVAVDSEHNTVGVWEKNLRKYPLLLLVDRKGLVVWKGDLSSRFGGGGGFTINFNGSSISWGESSGRSLEDILPDVVSGKFDIKKEQALAEQRKEMNEAQWGRKWDELAALSDKALAEDPLDTSAFDHRAAAYHGKSDFEGYRKFVRAHAEKVRDDAKWLRHVADGLVNGAYDWRDVELALSLAKRSVDATKSADAQSLACHARILHMVGLLEQAIEQQKKAVALEAKDESYKKALGFYEQCLSARRNATPKK